MTNDIIAAPGIEVTPGLPNMNLRTWQSRCLQDQLAIIRNGGQDFFTAAGVGSGKTTSALALFLVGGFDLIVAVTPRSGIRDSWHQDARKMHLKLHTVRNLTQFRKIIASGDLGQGFILNDGMLAGCSEEIAALCLKKRILAVGDEAHHLGEGMSWAKTFKETFVDADFRLCMSGTPFRSDDKRVEGLTYVTPEGEDAVGLAGIPHFTYTYEQALADGYVPPIITRFISGTVVKEMDDGRKFTYTFDHHQSMTGFGEMDEREMNQRLRAATVESEDWQVGAIEAARKSLMDMRQDGRPWAAVVVCKEIEQSKNIGEMIESRWGDKCMVLVGADDTEEGVREFNANKSLVWMIAVGKISEGVSIPRLRVGVYLSSLKTRTHFEQMRGRLARLYFDVDENGRSHEIPPAEQFCQFFVPADPRLVQYALESNRLTFHAIEPYAQADTEGNKKVDELFAELKKEQGDLTSEIGIYSIAGDSHLDGAAIDGELVSEDQYRAKVGESLSRGATELPQEEQDPRKIAKRKYPGISLALDVLAADRVQALLDMQGSQYWVPQSSGDVDPNVILRVREMIRDFASASAFGFRAPQLRRIAYEKLRQDHGVEVIGTYDFYDNRTRQSQEIKGPEDVDQNGEQAQGYGLLHAEYDNLVATLSAKELKAHFDIKENCLASARRYPNVSAWRVWEPAAANGAGRNGWLKECTDQMPKEPDEPKAAPPEKETRKYVKKVRRRY